MHAKPTDCRTWYVVFDRPTRRCFRWWHLFTGWRFGHVWAFTAAGDDMIVRVDPLAWGIHVQPLELKIGDVLLELAQRPITGMLSITVDYKISSVDDVRRGVYSCVSVLKAVLGLRKCPLVITPFQLYKYLCKHEGCIPLKAYIPYIMGEL